MIFKQQFIDMIISGRKTQTRRPNRGYYKVGHDYAIQPCRTCKGLPDYRLVIDRIWVELIPAENKRFAISVADAWTEGYFSVSAFEGLFRVLYPKWNGKKRWVFEFHLVEVKNENREEKKCILI